MTAPILIIGIGNPSRGDDALGPIAVERLAELDLPGVELLTDFQLQVEFVLDLRGRDKVIFIDASEELADGYAFGPVTAQADRSYTSHELTPAALLHAYQQTYGTPPGSWTLAIHGDSWALGEPPTTAALAHLDAALNRLLDFLAEAA